MAVMSLVSEQGADAMGAFGRQADTAAGRQQRPAAQWENLKITLGEKLLPVFSGLMNFLGTTALPKLEQLGGYVSGTIVPAFQATAGWIKENSTWLTSLAAGIGAVAVAWGGYQLAMTIASASRRLT